MNSMPEIDVFLYVLQYTILGKNINHMHTTKLIFSSHKI